MKLTQILRKIYEELFFWAFDGEYDFDRIFKDFDQWHDKALPEDKDVFSSMYAKVFKSRWFAISSPIVYVYLKYLAMKYTNTEYLQRLIERDIENEN